MQYSCFPSFPLAWCCWLWWQGQVNLFDDDGKDKTGINQEKNSIKQRQESSVILMLLVLMIGSSQMLIRPRIVKMTARTRQLLIRERKHKWKANIANDGKEKIKVTAENNIKKKVEDFSLEIAFLIGKNLYLLLFLFLMKAIQWYATSEHSFQKLHCMNSCAGINLASIVSWMQIFLVLSMLMILELLILFVLIAMLAVIKLRRNHQHWMYPHILKLSQDFKNLYLGTDQKVQYFWKHIR